MLLLSSPAQLAARQVNAITCHRNLNFIGIKGVKIACCKDLDSPLHNRQTRYLVKRITGVKAKIVNTQSELLKLIISGWGINHSTSRIGLTAPKGRSLTKLNRTIRFQAYKAKRINTEALVLP